MSEHTHVHEAGQPHMHSHEPGQPHDHHHDGDTYFTDQLCMVGLSGAFGSICLCLWFWKTDMLTNMLAPQFHLYVLLSGIALVVIAFGRGCILWRQSRDSKFSPGHDHDHAHDHEHHVKEGAPPQLAVSTEPLLAPPAPHGHEHKPGEACDHDHTHPHEHHIGHAHVAPDHDEADHDHGWAPWRYVVILIPIIFFLLGLPGGSVNLGAASHEQLIGDFTSIIYEAMPFIVLGVLIAGLLEEFVPQQAIARIASNTKVLVGVDLALAGVFALLALSKPSLQPLLTWIGVNPPVELFWVAALTLLGVLALALLVEMTRHFIFPSLFSGKLILAIGVGCLLGLVFPMCECGIIVVMKRLLRKGLPLSVSVAYMLAGPVINFVVMTSTFVAFSSYDQAGKNDVLGGPWFMVAWRVGLSYLVACVTALVVDWQWQRHGKRLLHPSVLQGLHTAGDDDNVVRRPWGEKFNNITHTALHDFVDIMAFLILGAILAAGGKYIIRESNVQQFLQDTPAVAILMMMGIAILFCLCSEADAFVAANFPLFWPDSSKLAFLVLGPMLDFKLLLMYTRVFRARLIYTIVTCLVVQVFAYTMVVEYAGFGKKHPPEVKPITLPPNVETYLFGIGMGPDPLAQFVHFGVAYRPSGKGVYKNFKEVYEMADRPDLRQQWRNEVVEVLGQFSPQGDQFFYLVRYKINCCASDATPSSIPVVARENLPKIAPGTWVRVTGRLEFRETSKDKFITLLIVSKADDVVGPVNPDPNPYFQ
jgi:uncharacterized protein